MGGKSLIMFTVIYPSGTALPRYYHLGKTPPFIHTEVQTSLSYDVATGRKYKSETV